MSDELLGRVDVFQQPFEELVGKTLLHGRGVLLHVLQTSVGFKYHKEYFFHQITKSKVYQNK